MRSRARSLLPISLLLFLAGSRSPGDVSGVPLGPIVVLIGLDGFEPSYLSRPPSRHLRELARQGVQARWMTPVFPSLTFPNFYSIATGLYPEHHGIVSNTMLDSALGSFSLRDRSSVEDPRWWGGEPIWVTAVKQNQRAATYFWPGSEAEIKRVRPTYYKIYNSSAPDAARVWQVLQWLSLPSAQAPSLLTVYFNDVDDAGHRFGPNAPETDSAIARVDSAVGALMDGLEQRSLTSKVNLIVVSDHGMAEVAPDHVIHLEQLIDTAEVNLVDEGPIVSLSPKSGRANEIIAQLRRSPHLKVYRKSEIPAALHYRAQARIQPILAIADEGWIATARSGASIPKGMHGYPPDLPSMRALFLARGPAFARGAVVPPFQNIHVYDLVAHILGLTPAANDGSLDSIRAVLSK
ncbi:MAG TPA: ectonucleotide pyrophosphatase/phosphodiesterase [Gemmatimonadales bacterium]|nr:ectonucleotide pyrophosphatase/phosphodiesterase [Gemmatimonadales bacterium]